MDFNDLKINFTEYLINQGIISEKEYVDSDNTASVFMHAQEFKEYLHNELKCDTSIYQESIFDILQMQIIDGKLVNPEEAEKEVTDEEDANKEDEQNLENDNTAVESLPNDEITNDKENKEITSDNPNDKTDSEITALIEEQLGKEADENNLLFEIFNDLIKDEKFISAIDLDTNNELSVEELANFFNTIKSYDLDESNVSFEDIMQAVEKINDNSFELWPDAIEPIEESPEIEETQETQAPATGGTTGSGGGGNATSYNSTPQEKTLDNMSKDELNSELTKAKTDFDEKNNTLSSILDGSYPELQNLESQIDESYKLYLTELEKVDEQTAKNFEELKESINTKEEEINKQEQEIINQEITVSTAENNYNNAISTRQVLESTLSSLQQVDTSDLDGKQKSEISEKISTVQSEIEKAKLNEKNAKQTLEKEKGKLEDLNNKKSELETGEGGLNELNSKMSELEAQIIEKYPQVEEYLNSYKEAKENYQTQKDTLISTAKSELEKSQKYVNEVQSAINNYDNREMAMKYSFDGLTDLTRKAVELAYTQIGVSETEGANRGDNEKYGAGAGVPWCAAFVSWLFGKGQGNSGNNPLKFTASVSSLRDQAKAAGYYSSVGSYTPKPGDIMIQKNNASHTGIVVKVEGNTIYTIEGNSGNAVRERQYTIGSSGYNKISGWIRMNDWSMAA